MSLQPGQRIGPYRIVEGLGTGAMGEVFLAFHETLEARFALKVLARDLVEDEQARARFATELESLSRVIEHPGIVHIHSAGRTPDGRPYYAMEYVDGGSLRDALRTGIGVEHALHIVRQLAEILAYAHERGLIHRDLKPANVLLASDGTLRLSDFGLAKLLDPMASQQGLTQTGELIGTPAYMAPEQVDVSLGPAGPWTDVYALGVMLYEALTGTPPLMGSTGVEIWTQLMEGAAIPPLRSKVQGLDPRIDTLVAKALERDPRGRFQDAGELAAALRALSTAPAAAPADRRTLLLLVSFALVGVLAGGVGVAYDVRRRARVSEGEQQLRDLEALASEGRHAEVIARGSSSGPRGAALVRASRVALIKEAVEAGDMRSARERLAALGDAKGVPVPDRPWILASCGEMRAALAAPDLSEQPAARARIAAWVGDLQAARAALELLPAPRKRALAWELSASLEGLNPEPSEGLPDAGWPSLAVAEEATALELYGLAGLALEGTRSVDDAELKLAGAFLQVRLDVAQGRPRLAAEHWLELYDLATHPLARARALTWGAVILLANGDDAELCARLDEAAAGSVVEAARRCAPGLPLTRWFEATLAWVPAQAERFGASQAEPQRLPWQALLDTGGDVAQELTFSRSGRLGVLGALAARCARLSELCELGNGTAGAREAVRLTDLALRLAPASPTLWVARSRACRVLHDASGAQAAAKQATRLAPGDATCLVALAEAEAAAVDGFRQRADDARWKIHGNVDPELERTYLDALSSVSKSFARALDAAAPGSPPELDARLGGAWILLRRARHRALAERAREALAQQRDHGDVGERKDGEVSFVRPPELDEARDLLHSLLRSIKVNEILAARAALAAGLERGATRSELSSLEVALHAAAGGSTAEQLEALLLGASLWTDQAPAYARAYLGAVGDLPARALLAAREVDASSEVGRELADHAASLAPDAPAVVAMRLRLSARQSGLGAEHLRDMGRLASTSPDWIPRLLAGASRAKGELIHQLGGEEDALARGLLLVALARRAKDDRARERQARDALLALAPRRAGSGPGVGLLRFLARQSLGDLPPLRLPNGYDTACVRGYAPWCSPALLADLTTTLEPENTAEELLTHGFLSNHRAIYEEGQRPKGENGKRVREATQDLPRLFSREGMDDRFARLRVSLDLQKSHRHPWLTAVLRLEHGLSDHHSELERRGYPFEDLFDSLRKLHRSAAYAARGRYWAERRWIDDEHPRRALKAARFAARAWEEGFPAGSRRRVRSPWQLPGLSATLREPQDPSPLVAMTRPFHPRFWRMWFRLNDPGVSQELASRMLSELGHQPHARNRALSPEDLFLAYGRTQALLGSAQDAPSLGQQQDRLLDEFNLPGESRLALDRQAAFSDDRQEMLAALYHYAFWRMRWRGVDPSAAERDREHHLRAGIAIARLGHRLSASEEQRASFLSLAGDMAVDSVAWSAGEERVRWTRQAKADLEHCLHVDPALEQGRLLAPYRILRKLHISGEDPKSKRMKDSIQAMREAVREADDWEFADLLKQYILGDPLRPEMQRSSRQLDRLYQLMERKARE